MNKRPKSHLTPKWLEKAAIYFPTFQFVLIATQSVIFFRHVSLLSGGLLLAVIYLLPLFLFRVLCQFFELRRGVDKIGISQKNGHFWIVAHRLQYLFITFPALEKTMILIPGLFSLWLRAWGSTIGRHILWTPRVQVLDRTDLNIGDYCFVGDHAYLSSHFIVRRKGQLYLYYDKIQIGPKVLIGAHCHLGPGLVIKDQTFVPSYSKGMRTQRNFEV